MQQEKKRVFFGLEVSAPWPDHLPEGRLLDRSHRHITLAFLGGVDFQKLQDALQKFPQPNLKVGLGGKFDCCLLLPEKHPNVVAWHVSWSDDSAMLVQFQKELVKWLLNEEMPDAYKNVDAVVEVVQNAGLAKMAARLKPYLVVKG